MYNKKYRSGLTLIELLIVILILTAFAVITIPRMSHSAVGANTRSCATNIAVLNSAIEQYYVTNGDFPAELRDVSQDTTFFPNGPPECPVNNNPYSNTLTAINRVDATQHAH